MVITLIGYRGTGKSTVGQLLAARLDWDFVDSDREIERQAGKSIAAIFTEDGEPHFRHLEREEINRQLHRDHVVLSAGGGAILDDLSRQQMPIAGPVVWLQASVETIVERISSDADTNDNRPSLTGQDVLNEVEQVLRERESKYAEAATIVIQTDGRDVTAIVDDIITHIPVEEQ